MEFDYEEYLDDYFEPMELSDEEKEDRKEIAKEIRDVMLWWLLTLLMYLRFGLPYEEDTLRSTLRSRLANVIYSHSTADAYLLMYIDKLTKEVSDTTFKRVAEKKETIKEDDYIFSDQRATEIGANEANSIGNHEEYLKAIEAGMKYKRWVAFKDNRVRKDHERMDGKKIPIKEYFKFPDCKGLYPHDEVHLSAKQTVNCRCVAKYSFK